MKKKKVLKITPVLVLLNILIIIIICTFYLFRLIKYYRLEHNTKPGESVKLVDALIKKQSYLDITKGLVLDEENNVYNYLGDVKDNYLNYSGITFRIMSIDENKNVRLVSDDILTYMYSGLENGYEKSFVNKWLNSSEEKYSGIFENILYDKDNILVNSDLCTDTIDDLNNITCDKVNDTYKVSMLTLNDYKIAGGKNSYLNNGKSYYLGSLNSENGNYYLLESGDIALNVSNSKVSGVRAVITIKGDLDIISGDGNKDNPYVIEKHEIAKLSDTYVGQYISIGKDTFKVVEPVTAKTGAKINSLANPEKKMSKSESDKGTIYLLEDLAITRKKLMSAVTDSDTRIVFDPANKPGISNLLTIMSALTNEPVEEIAARFDGQGYGTFKKAVADVVCKELEELQNKVKEIQKSGIIDEVLKNGAERASYHARKKLSKVYRKVGLR